MGDPVDVLGEAMQWSLPRERYEQLLPAFRQCLFDADITSVDRIAMFDAQVGHESVGLLYMEELASGAAYEGRVDLGNTEPGDGERYKGRGPIQVTGRHNYTVCSQWAFDNGIVPTPTYFVDDPGLLASDQYGFVGPTWYWFTQRPLNDASDRRDLEGATQMVNGGLNGIDDRRQRYEHNLRMGDRLLDLLGDVPPPPPPPELRGEVVLNYDHDIVPQETGYWCGPASAQILLNTRGIIVSEATLAAECGTHTGGTDSIHLIERCLDAPGRLPEADYTSVELPNDPPTGEERDRFWGHLTNSINAGYGLIMNWVVPASNRPRGVKGSPNPSYGNKTTFHYVTAMGYDDMGERAVWVADPGFQPFGFWVSFDQCTTLMPPKGYVYAASTANVQPPQFPPPPGGFVSGDPVLDELMGAAPHHAVEFWPGTPWAAIASSLQDKTTRHAYEWLRAHKAYDVGRPGTTEEDRQFVGPFDSVARILFEMTLWLGPLDEAALRQKFGQPDTVVGYARDAVSWAKVIADKLDAVNERLDRVYFDPAAAAPAQVDPGYDYPGQPDPGYLPPGAAGQYPEIDGQRPPPRPDPRARASGLPAPRIANHRRDR